jgi:hypothetical protein
MLTFVGADSPSFFNFKGHIEKSAADEIAVPPLALRIDRQNLKKETDTILTAADNDGSFASFTLGENYYVYALQSADGAEPEFAVSINSTYPDGYTENNSRKIGGFHYGRIRTNAQRYDDAASIAVNIIPNSVWSLNYRPACDPTGMVKVSNFWADIYLASEGSGTWPETELVSEYNATPVSGTEGYNDYDFIRGLANVNKRKLTGQEWDMAAYGSPEGHDGDNNAAWSATSNSGRTATGTVEQAVSCYNLVDCAGNLWERIDEYMYRYAGTSSFDWHDVLNMGKDSSYQHGEAYMQGNPSIVVLLAGGNFGNGGSCGSRAVYSYGYPWYVNTTFGVRGACDHQSA